MTDPEDPAVPGVEEDPVDNLFDGVREIRAPDP